MHAFVGLYSTKSICSDITDKDTKNVNLLDMLNCTLLFAKIVRQFSFVFISLSKVLIYFEIERSILFLSYKSLLILVFKAS